MEAQFQDTHSMTHFLNYFLQTHHRLCVLLLFVLSCAGYNIRYFDIEIFHLLPLLFRSLVDLLYVIICIERFRLFNKLFSRPRLPDLFASSGRYFSFQNKFVSYHPSGLWLSYFLNSSYTTSSPLHALP